MLRLHWKKVPSSSIQSLIGKNCRDLVNSRRPLNILPLCLGFKGLRLYGTDHAHSSTEEQFNEPTGYLFGRKPGEKWNLDPETKLYIIFYLGGLAAFCFLWQYRPDTDPQAWAKKEALKRMNERGVNLEDYIYKLPKVY